MPELDLTRDGIVAPVRPDRDRTGGRPSPQQVRGKGWRRVAKGLYVPSGTDGTRTEQRIVEAVAGGPSGSAATGWAALAWRHAPWFDGTSADGSPLPVPLSLGDNRTVAPRQGVLLCEDWLFADDVECVDGLPVTSAQRSVSYEIRRARSLVDAVVALEMAAYADLVDLASFGDYVARLGSRPGVRRLRAALPLARENSWSPQETVMRLTWQRERRHGPLLCNPPLFGPDGSHLATPDLLDPEHAVAGEYNGAVHDGDEPRRRDLDREEELRSLGIEPVAMMAGDRRDPRGFLRRLDGAYARAAARRSTVRRWTLRPPSWWVDTATVAARRALDDEARAIWLRRRLGGRRT
ncbi:hypothetical protein [Nocardioides sp. SYSU DS0651]|uniref:hypothetical protein n=1 Tax=Nocardioides sp. SYSU DS0651 TaxID=3415955 RepID=UPI003F4C5300